METHIKKRFLLPMLLALLAIGNLAHSATITWTNSSGGNWSVAANWSPNQVPTNTDTVLITSTNTYTVILDASESFSSIVTNVVSLTLGAGGGAAGMQTFLVTNLTPSSVFCLSSQLLVTNGGVFQLTNGNLQANSMIIANGGVFNMAASSLYGNVTVAGGGVLNATGYNYAFGAVTVASGGVLNPSPLYLYGPSTNFGTINLTNGPGLSIIHDGTPNAHGDLINQAGGLINFLSDQVGIAGGGYLVNQGAITKSAGTGLNAIDVQFATNSGTITAQTGQMILAGQWTLLPSGSLNVVLNSATNYGSFFFYLYNSGNPPPPPIPGNAGLAGAFNATLTNGYVPTNGTTFNVLSYGSYSGNFNSLGLPAGVTWQSTFGATNLTLTAGGGKPQFGTFMLSGTNLVFNGTGGTAGSNYVILVSTNLTIPLTNWLAVTTNTFDGAGQFHYTNNVSPVKPRQFFNFKLP
jgi:hypothetical protein